jgi:hypothetical protein
VAGETEVLGENLSNCHFAQPKNFMRPEPSSNQSRRGGKPAIKRLTYGTAYADSYSSVSKSSFSNEMQ